MTDPDSHDFSSQADLSDSGPRDYRDQALLLRRATSVALFIGVGVAVLRLSIVPVEALESRSQLFLSLSIYLLLAGWCLFDSRYRRKPMVPIALAALFVVPPLAFPIYCFWSRGWRGFLLLLYFFLAYVVLAVSVMVFVEPRAGSYFATN